MGIDAGREWGGSVMWILIGFGIWAVMCAGILRFTFNAGKRNKEADRMAVERFSILDKEELWRTR